MTSIEWLASKLSITFNTMYADEIEQAKEMHKQEIIDAVLFGMQKGLNINKVPETDNNWLNNYYQETFKK